MKNALKVTIALSGVLALSGCADLVTGGPLIRPGEPLAAIRVVNATGSQLNAVLISACSASTYGLNRLPDGMDIADLRRATDVEFGMATYEPFGISPLEPLGSL